MEMVLSVLGLYELCVCFFFFIYLGFGGGVGDAYLAASEGSTSNSESCVAAAF